MKCRLDVPDRDFEKVQRLCTRTVMKFVSCSLFSIVQWKFAILQTIAPFDYLSEG